MKSDFFHLGNISFDPTTREVIDKDGRPVQLRNKSKAVLEFMLESPNRTVSKSDILENVWRESTVSDESLVQCIADIRRIIGPDARKIVETVPREGYRINPHPAPLPQKRAASLVPLGFATALALALLAFWSQGPQDLPVTGPDAVATVPTSPPGTPHRDAYLEMLQGRVSANRFDKTESLIAERHFRKAIEIDPKFARAYAELGTLIAVRFENDWTVLHDADRDKAMYYADKAIELDPDLWLGHYALGRLHSVFSDLERSEVHLRKAMALKPENEDARAYLGAVLNFQGKTEEALAVLEQAVTSHPDPPYWYLFSLGHVLFNLERYEDAERVLNQCLSVAKDSPYCLRYLIATLGELGNRQAAEQAGRTYQAMGFDLSVDAISGLMTFHHPHDRAQLEAGLRRAGVPK